MTATTTMIEKKTSIFFIRLPHNYDAPSAISLPRQPSCVALGALRGAGPCSWPRSAW